MCTLTCTDPEGGWEQGVWTPITNLYDFFVILVQIPWKSQSYQASTQCWAIISQPAKQHFNVVSLAGQWGSHLVVLGSSLPSSTKKKRCPPWTTWQTFLDPRMFGSLDCKHCGSRSDCSLWSGFNVCFHGKIILKFICSRVDKQVTFSGQNNIGRIRVKF